MARIVIRDLIESTELDRAAMIKVTGGRSGLPMAGLATAATANRAAESIFGPTGRTQSHGVLSQLSR